MRKTCKRRQIPRNAEIARRTLLSIIDRKVERLKPIAAALEARSAEDAANQADRLSFDFSPEGERMRRAERRSFDTFFSTLDQLIELHKNGGKAAPSQGQRREEPAAPTRKAAIANGKDGVAIPRAPRPPAPAPPLGAPARSHDRKGAPIETERLQSLLNVRRAAGVPAAASADNRFSGSDDSALADFAAFAAPGVTQVTQGSSLRHPVSPLPARR